MQEFDLIVIGGGPGGYLCAERAGKAGLRTALIEKRALGGTCLNEGCIPTKSLLYCAKQYQAALHGAEYGVTAQNVSIDHAQVVARKDGVVRTLVRGVGAAMKAHGVTVFAAEGRILGKTGERFEVAAGSVVYSDASGRHEIACGRVLLSAGRRADVTGLNVEALGIALERGAVVTDRQMRTNVPGVWAVGDCNGKLMLAHTAYREAEVAVNDMLGKKDAIDYSIIPSVIYTTPEVACVGETEQSAREKGLDVQVVKAPMALSGRYLAENPKGTGFCKLLYDRKNRCVVGVHMVGSYVSEIIYGAAMMVHSKLPVQHLDKIVFPHPTVGEVVREALFLL